MQYNSISEKKLMDSFWKVTQEGQKGLDCLITLGDCCKCSHNHEGAYLQHKDGSKEPIGCICEEKGDVCSRYNCLDCNVLGKTSFCFACTKFKIQENLHDRA